MESAASHQLFVYGSLREGFHQDAYNYISRFFSFVSTACVKGILSDSEIKQVAIPSSGNSFIKGDLYKLNKEGNYSWAFGQLDDYEGLDAEPGEIPLYRRELITVCKEDGSFEDAWIYWFNAEENKKSVVAPADV
jgi:gamma-glutamylcyclotransferase (GGCT)/AIG2-like uncharacterized protein YtfP